MAKDLRTVPRAPGRLPVLGHLLPLWRSPLDFLKALPESGELVRVDLGTMPVYVVTTPQLTNDLLVRKAPSFARGRLFERARGPLGIGLPTADGEFHRKHRRLMQPMFHRNQIDQYAAVMSRKAEDMADSWQAGRTLALNQESYAFAIHTLSETMFSNTISPEAAEQIRRHVPVMIKYTLVRALQPKVLERVPVRANRDFDLAAATLRSIIDDVIATTRRVGPREDAIDLLSLLISARDADNGEGLTDLEIRDELVGTLFTGTETSASTMSWAFHELARHPDVEKKVVAEIRDVVGDGPVRAEHIPQLAYLNRVLDEVTRLHAIPLLMRRTIEPVEFGGVALPAGTEVAYSLYALHQDRRLYPNPRQFDPDRWLLEPGRERPRENFVPFGAGVHKCIGEQYARMEMAIGLATVLSRWRLVPEPGAEVREVAAAVAYPDRLPMIPQPREAA
ncbi:cytochrome P450 [Yinghuangia sp. ASG 101]|uniref:cytochrome P450 n=1 Tax=Yinghuangia sp. ASG 101 TaxID=2896848 RepID=UPI0022B225E0|nr:cytochrome P450 [Yinghuangia sp. ASG 101]